MRGADKFTGISTPKWITRKAKGHYLIVDPENPDIERDTLCCVHCRRHWEVNPGSGIKRGWCGLCHGPTCGSHHCDRCVPYEKMLEEIERKATRLLRLGV